MATFRETIETKFAAKSFLCIGLDSAVEQIPASVRKCFFEGDDDHAIREFNERIIKATAPFAAAFKINPASYFPSGEDGWNALFHTCGLIREFAPDAAIILDGKFGDVGHANEGYARFAFDYLRVDAVTVNPYAGEEALRPFLDRDGKGVFVLCRTSNPGADEFQSLRVSRQMITGGLPNHFEGALFEYVAQVACRWQSNAWLGLVVGATEPTDIIRVNRAVNDDDVPFLIPGVGAQGGDLAAAVKAAVNTRGDGFLVNVGRDIIFASAGEDFDEAAGREAGGFHKDIQVALGLINRYRLGE